MGSATAMGAAAAAPERFSRLVLGGVGGDWLAQQHGSAEARLEMGRAMVVEEPASITNPGFRSFRAFVEEQGEDRRAMAACISAPAAPPSPEALRRLPMPVLVVAGARDHIAGDPEALARAFGDGRGVSIPGCDHFSAIPHALTKAAVFDFFDGMLEADADPFARSF
jgi:pimeloyl-ACP methyl ester carboxylesterase